MVADYCRGQHWTEARARAVIRQLLDLCVTAKPPEPEPETSEATVLTEVRKALQRPQLAPSGAEAGFRLRNSN